MRRTLRLLHNGSVYSAGHDTILDAPPSVPVFHVREGEADTFTLDMTGYLPASPSVSWAATGCDVSGAAVSGRTASAVLSGFSSSTIADVTVTATASGVVAVVPFRVSVIDAPAS